MVDILSESLLSPAEAAEILPHRRAGKKPNVATIYRWMQVGCKGIRLEFAQIGGTRCPSRESLARFFGALTAKANGQAVPPPPAVTSRAQRAAVRRAERVLDKAGI